jgi:hypothetical protein
MDLVGVKPMPGSEQLPLRSLASVVSTCLPAWGISFFLAKKEICILMVALML